MGLESTELVKIAPDHKLLNICNPQFLYLYNGDNNTSLKVSISINNNAHDGNNDD